MHKKVVVLGGGTGISFLLRGLKEFPVDITAVITVSDNGRSTGTLREEFNIPAVGDVRKVVSNMSNIDEDIKKMMEYRFKTNSYLNGHALGNLIFTAMMDITGSLEKSIASLSKLLDVNHKVLPLSEDCLTLMGETIDGKIIEGEAEITKAKTEYKKIYYKEEPHVLEEVLKAIEEADLIILSMGSLYTSILPHIISKQIKKAIKNAKADTMYLCNAFTQPGETDNYKVSDHIKLLNHYLGKNTIDVVIASNTKIDKELALKYANEEQKDPVEIDYEEIKKQNVELIEGDLLTLTEGTLKHDSMKVSHLVFNYLMKE